jgi:hypothetical protein
MNDTVWVAGGWIVGGVLVALAVRFATKAMRAAKRPIPGAGEIGLALVFLFSGRMPPPPPRSQIEAELDGEKDRLGSESLSKSPDTSLERSRGQ